VPKVSQEHREARREQILEGARRCFARHGYEGATVARLEQEIGLSRGAIFNYFDSKWDLFYALAERDTARGLQIFAEEGVDALVRHVAEESPDWLRTDPGAREQWAQRAPEQERRALERMQELQANGQVRNDIDADEIGTFIGLILDGLVSRRAFGFPTNVDPLLKLVHAAIEPK
jgi:AcrR family transcriptional regulator